MERRETTVWERENKRRQNSLLMKTLISVLILILVGLTALLVHELFFHSYQNPWADSYTGSIVPGSSLVQESETEEEDFSGQSGETGSNSIESKANIMASQYDYDGAIELLKAQPGFQKNLRRKGLANSYQAAKGGLVPYPVDQIPHVFFHTLIADDALAFDGDQDEAGYNQVMTTISEFNSIIEQMYNKGYVMVSLHDMCSVLPDGTVKEKEILLPPGKIPFVLSQDDCSYYHYMDGDGFADRLIVDTDGRVRNSYIEKDGSVSIGSYDVVPLIDDFVEKHPDFSYHGHKGIIALTGYEGVLGYRTDEVYKTRESSRITKYQQAFFDSHPDFDFDAECAEAKAVADAMKEEGWEFASHTWGHIAPRERTMESVRTDNERWQNYVAPIVGETNVLIFAFGADISDWEPYTHENPLFDYYKSAGFDLYCNVDGSVRYWVQFGNDYMRQGRRNLDGYRMYYNPELLSDLFDVSQAWDQNRPVPVPEM